MATHSLAYDASCSIDTLTELVTALRDWQVDVDAVLAAASLRSEQLDDPETRISHEQYQGVWQAALAATGDPALGLHVLEHPGNNRLNLLTYIASTAPNGRQAFERAHRYTRIAHDALEIEVRVEGGNTICATRFRGQRCIPTIAEFAVGLMVKLAPRIVGGNHIREAWFAHPAPDYVAEYHRVLGVPVRFDAPCDGVVGDGRDLDSPLPHSDETLCGLLEEQAAEKLARMPAADDFAARVRQCIATALPSGDPTAEGVASALGLSARTLRRRLSTLGLSHQQLLDEVRCELALLALRERGASVGEVAYLLGFSDTSAFHKAFRRWTGKRPSDVVRAGR